jgi:hypothetical protein
LFPRHLRVGEAGFGIEPSGSITLARMTDIGAHRKHDILPMDFRSSPENGHSRYGNRTARFASIQPFVAALADDIRRLRSARSISRLLDHLVGVGEE